MRVEFPRFKTHYDVMLHIGGGNVSRTVAFVVHNDAPVWSGEQEIHYGPSQFDTVDGTVREHFTLTYHTIEGSGAPKGLNLDYRGPESTLQERANRHLLSVAEAKQVWNRWPQ